ncbi:MAG: hypothetical protein KDC54_14490, partial [Lewinella sp.]|nr:hypothetical protein [Lewinella sp.]
LNRQAVAREPVIIRFGFDLLPPEEILEHVAYPGVSTMVVLDGLTGEPLGQLTDLPFVVDDVVTSEDHSKLLMTHLPPVQEERLYQTEEYFWRHFASIYELAGRQLCYQVDVRDEVFVGKDRWTGVPYIDRAEEWRGAEDKSIDRVLSVLVGTTLYSLPVMSDAMRLEPKTDSFFVDGVCFSYEEAPFSKVILECE